MNHRLVRRYLPAVLFAAFACISENRHSALAGPLGAAGDLYVPGQSSNNVVQFDGATGAFVGVFVPTSSGGLNGPWDLIFGPDGQLYVASFNTNSVIKYNGSTGALIGDFVSPGSGSLSGARSLEYNANGDLLVGSSSNGINAYDGATGASLGTFVAVGSGGLSDVRQMAMGPNGNLFVASNNTSYIIQYDGTTGALIGNFAGTVSGLVGAAFGGPSDNLFASSAGAENVPQFNGVTGAAMGVFASGGGLSGTRHITFGGPNGNLFVCGVSSNTIVEFNRSTGAVVRSISNGALNGPYGLRFKVANDCNSNGTVDATDIAGPTSEDCNSTGVPDECEIPQGSMAPGGPFFCTAGCSFDCNSNGIPDECEGDCNSNGIADTCDIAGPTSTDCNTNNLPDDCEIAGNDCNTNDLPDECDLSIGTSGDCNANSQPDECEGPAGDVNWTGPSGGSFSESAYWSPPMIPTAGANAILENTTAVDNRCVVTAGTEAAFCSLSLSASGTGRQILQINLGGSIDVISGTTVSPGGEVLLQGGSLGGGPIANAANTIRGYGVIAADVTNDGLIEGQIGGALRFTGDSLDNQPAATIRAPVASVLHAQTPALNQQGTIEIRSNATLAFDAALVNQSGSQVTILGGTLEAASVSNDAGASLNGFGTIDTSVVNEGEMLLIADTQIIGDLQNDGTITIQSGILTITGNLSGTGTIIGGFGG